MSKIVRKTAENLEVDDRFKFAGLVVRVLRKPSYGGGAGELMVKVSDHFGETLLFVRKDRPFKTWK